MIRVKGTYQNRSLQLDESLELPEGTEVMVEIHPVADVTDDDWRQLGLERLEAEWDNPNDAIYDNWKELYGV
jgi:hypothetical protein